MRAEQSVIDLDVDWWNLDLPPRQNRLYQILLQVLEPGSAAAFNPVLQSLFDFPFPFLGRQLQDPQILSVRRLWTILSQLVVGDSEQDSGMKSSRRRSGSGLITSSSSRRRLCRPALRRSMILWTNCS